MTQPDDAPTTPAPVPFLPPTGPEPVPAPPAHAPDRAAALDAAAALEEVLHEAKRVVVGQDPMLERVLVALLAGGHVLLEGVPGLAKTLTVKTLAQVMGGTFSRVQFTPDLVPADLVGTRVWRPDTGAFDIELGPVFGNLLLADEINRAPAKVQSALLEVMQEQQVTIGGQTFPVPSPFLVLATQNPIESEGTYPLPEAQVDRFLLKILVDYPAVEDEASVVARVIGGEPEVRRVLEPEALLQHRATVRQVAVDRRDMAYAVTLADATRHPERHGLPDLAPRIEIGASPRGPIGMVQAAQALALLRGRGYVTSRDIRDVAPDVLRHRLVLSYEAHADGVTPDHIIDRVLEAVPAPAMRTESAA
ncbi:MAG: MoxR family ATPase [Solirubrobacteraceae bacterium]|jgi:MoxR-like ATPase|nr:MoxR family ATPase [Solirubrobacteraceae bacterium]